MVRLEAGAKSALDPHEQRSVRPYIADEVPNEDFDVAGVTAIEPKRTLWDKIVIAHGLRRWHERRGNLRQEGHRVSRHYYDLRCLLHSEIGPGTLADRALGEDCVRHARLFFDRPDFDLASARQGSFAIAPHAGMIDALRRDYDLMSAMIFGTPPAFADILESLEEIEVRVNAG
ncbi:MAG: nucleotidyl transferase AbiEii/AbiGii toxin family protein [Gemmatimonadaceae bacterium]|nr:nucleotidyl transferase AbiEii/AbiGii toxin family protein [Gemmatimonadaceae bacterium]